jgi:hypothetical protein
MLTLQRTVGPCTRPAQRSAFKANLVPCARPGLRIASRSVRARTDDGTTDPNEKIKEYTDKIVKAWDDIDDKPTFLLYSGVAVFALVVASNVLNALDRVPLIPGTLKFVGIVYSGWFTYKYLLFAEGRAMLSEDFDNIREGLKSQVVKGNDSGEDKIRAGANDVVSKVSSTSRETRTALKDFE